MTPPRPRLTITDDLPEGQALREDLVSTLDNQYSCRSYEQIDDMVTNWQQDNNVTLRQTTTTTMTKEVVVPNRTPVVQQPPPLPRWTSEQIAASFAAFRRPTIQAAMVPPLSNHDQEDDNSQAESSMMASPLLNVPHTNERWAQLLPFLDILIRQRLQLKKTPLLPPKCKQLMNLFRFHRQSLLRTSHLFSLLSKPKFRSQKVTHQSSH